MGRYFRKRTLLDTSAIIPHRCPYPIFMTKTDLLEAIGFFALLSWGYECHLRSKEKKKKTICDIEVSHRKKIIMYLFPDNNYI